MCARTGRISRSGWGERCNGRAAFRRRNTPGRKSRRGGTVFWPRWKRWCRGRGWLNVCGRSTRRANAAGRRLGWSGCCGSTFCSSGTGWPTRPWRTRYTIAWRCAASPASICRWRRFRTRLNFRHWLEEHDLTRALFDEIGAMLEERGLLMRQGTIVDATIIAAPPSTKNKSKARDPEMHQTKKGNQWHFGMKAHIGVDVASGVVHTVVGTAANEADINQTAALLHGQEEAVFADAGYTGADKRLELEDCDVSWNIAIKRSIIKALPKDLRDWAEAVESALSQVRAWVEHPFHIVKNLFRHKKLRYRGLAKNTAQLHTLFALANLVIVKKTLLAQGRA